MTSPFFRPTFLLSLPTTWDDAICSFSEEFNRFLHSFPSNNSTDHHSDFVEILAILESFGKHRGVQVPKFEVGPNKSENIKSITHIIQTLGSTSKTIVSRRDAAGLQKLKTDEYDSFFEGIPAYEFSTDEFQQLQVLMNELRDLITKSNLITADHKRRLLRRLEAMQGELHKRTSDIDRFWGFIGEAGVTVRKFGEDMKPITERIQQLAKIVIGVIMAKEGIKSLPEVSKFLN